MTDNLGSGININHFFVEPSMRRRGRASDVLSALVEEARHMGYEYVVINMRGGDEAEWFLRHHGFSVVERVRDSVTAERQIASWPGEPATTDKLSPQPFKPNYNKWRENSQGGADPEFDMFGDS
jgi:Acetyltransferase (GNAT) family.